MSINKSIRSQFVLTHLVFPLVAACNYQHAIPLEAKANDQCNNTVSFPRRRLLLVPAVTLNSNLLFIYTSAPTPHSNQITSYFTCSRYEHYYITVVYTYIHTVCIHKTIVSIKTELCDCSLNSEQSPVAQGKGFTPTSPLLHQFSLQFSRQYISLLDT